MIKQSKLAALAVIMMVVISIFMLGACGGGSKTYKDGTYKGTSSVYENPDGSDDGNGYGEVEITISGGVITDASYTSYEIDGTLKDEDYGKANGEIANKDFYNKAQKAVAACDEYAKMLVEGGSLDGVDAISGATINYDNFVEATKNALKEAEE